MTNEDLVPQLRSVSLFSALSDKDLRQVAAIGDLAEHPAGSVLAEQDSGGVGFHLIVAGSAAVEVNGEPRGEMQVGDHFGEIALIDGEPRSATVRVGPNGATTFVLTSWKFHPLLTEHPEMSIALLKTLCARLRRAEAANEA